MSADLLIILKFHKFVIHKFVKFRQNMCLCAQNEHVMDLGSPSNMVRLRNALIERDLVYSEMQQLYLTDPVFALWFRKRFV